MIAWLCLSGIKKFKEILKIYVDGYLFNKNKLKNIERTNKMAPFDVTIKKN